MKRPKQKHRGKNSALKVKAKPKEAGKKNVFDVLFVMVLVGSILFKIYRADRAGIIYDESMTFMHYCESVHRAITNFSSTNNHILNSVLIVFAHKFFGFYEHFIRIPSLSAGILFSLSLAYIVYKTIESKAIRVAALALTSLVPFVFNFSFFARGYAFALAGVFTETALVLWLLDNKISFRYWWGPVLVISVMNFLALGAMLSAVLVLGAFNLLFVLFYSHKIYRNAVPRLKAVILNGAAIFLVSVGLLFSVYHAVCKEIPTNEELLKISRSWRGWPSFVRYINDLLVKMVFIPKDTMGVIIYYSFISLVVMGIIFCLFKFAKAFKSDTGGRSLNTSDVRTFIFLFTIITIVLMFVYGVLLNKSLGLERNSIFLIPLVLLCSAIIFDRLVFGIGNNIAGCIGQVIVVILMLSVLFHNPLSAVYSFKGGGSISGPMLRKLKSIDDDKVWNIGFSKKKHSHSMGFHYYQQFDYKFNVRGGQKLDLIICAEDEVPVGTPLLNWKYLEITNCSVVVNCPLAKKYVLVKGEG